HMDVRTDDGRSVSFDLKDYAHIDHGYAATFHKSQGVTVDQAHILATPGMDRHSAYVGLTRHRESVQLHYGRDDFADQSRLVRTLSRERAKDMASDYPLPDAAARSFAERREFRFGEAARDMVNKAHNLIADPDRIEALRGRLDKALGREPSSTPDVERTKDKKPEADRDANSAASRLHARMAELGKQVRKDDERDRDRTKDRDRGGPGR
ncbi:MAG: Ti-type conjugative transfer relaxase TraA, partial [Parasphingorhabdus sp.]